QRTILIDRARGTQKRLSSRNHPCASVSTARIHDEEKGRTEDSAQGHLEKKSRGEESRRDLSAGVGSGKGGDRTSADGAAQGRRTPGDRSRAARGGARGIRPREADDLPAGLRGVDG